MCKRRHHTIGAACLRIFLRPEMNETLVENRFVWLDKRKRLPETSTFLTNLWIISSL